MAHRRRDIVTHYFQAAQRRILCGVADRTAHWTTRAGVSCPRCIELLRALERAKDDAAREHQHVT